MKSNSSNNQAPNLELAAFFPYRLSILSNRVSNLIAREYAEKFDLSVPQWRVIMVLYGAAQLTASEIARATLMDRVRVTRTLQALLKTKLITRKASQSDGRSAYISLTAKGRSIYDEVAPLALAYEEQVLSGLSLAEQEQLESLLIKLSTQLDTLER